MNHDASVIPFRENKRHGSQDYPCAFYQVKSALLPAGTIFQTKHHWHEELEIIHFRLGRFQLEINMQKYEITGECFCFVGSGELHYIYSQEDYEEQALVFSLAGLSFAENDPVQAQIIRPLLDGDLALPAVVAENDACFDAVRRCFAGICGVFEGTADADSLPEQYTLADTAQYLCVKACLYGIFAALSGHGLLAATSALSESDRRIQTIKKALSYMKEHASEKLYMRDIAAQVNMNEQYFCRFFKKIIGKPPVEYLTELRIQNACKLLRSTDRSVMDVCLDCGFNNLGNFMRAFRKYCGCTPKQYQKSK